MLHELSLVFWQGDDHFTTIGEMVYCLRVLAANDKLKRAIATDRPLLNALVSLVEEKSEKRERGEREAGDGGRVEGEAGDEGRVEGVAGDEGRGEGGGSSSARLLELVQCIALLSFDDVANAQLVQHPALLAALHRLYLSDNSPQVLHSVSTCLYNLGHSSFPPLATAAQTPSEYSVTKSPSPSFTAVAPPSADTVDTGKPGGHIFISYSRASEDRVLCLRQMLEKDGYIVWLDLDHTKDGMAGCISAGIRNAGVVVLALSGAYKSSPNCRMEAEYSAASGKPLIALVVDESFSPSGWLATLLDQYIEEHYDGSGWGKLDLIYGPLTEEIDTYLQPQMAVANTVALTNEEEVAAKEKGEEKGEVAANEKGEEKEGTHAELGASAPTADVVAAAIIHSPSSGPANDPTTPGSSRVIPPGSSSSPHSPSTDIKASASLAVGEICEMKTTAFKPFAALLRAEGMDRAALHEMWYLYGRDYVPVLELLRRDLNLTRLSDQLRFLHALRSEFENELD